MGFASLRFFPTLSLFHEPPYWVSPDLRRLPAVDGDWAAPSRHSTKGNRDASLPPPVFVNLVVACDTRDLEFPNCASAQPARIPELGEWLSLVLLAIYLLFA